MSSLIRINEIFLSLQGETKTVGIPTVFIRLSGCPLRCRYCDTTYAYINGTNMSIESIVTQVKNYGIAYVNVTGGEPLAQPACVELLHSLCLESYQVSLETSGALDISGVDTKISRVVDLKTPGSGEVGRNLYTNIDLLTYHDQVKLVICDRCDYEWAKNKLREYNLAQRCEVLFSPVADQLAPTDLAKWILEDRLPVRFQLQLHKVLWGDEPGH